MLITGVMAEGYRSVKPIYYIAYYGPVVCAEYTTPQMLLVSAKESK